MLHLLMSFPLWLHAGGFRAEHDEEFEDREGNIYDRKTYELMKAQGLL